MVKNFNVKLAGRITTAFIILAAPAIMFAAPSAAVTVCPQAAANGNAAYQAAVAASGTCNQSFVFTDGGVTTVAGNPNPYDGSEDALIGIVNNSSVTITSVKVSNPGVDIFGLDGDGICFYTPFVSNSQPCNASAPGADNYAGSASSFTGINAALSSGTVNFSPGIPPGGTGYFSLEEQASVSTTVTIAGSDSFQVTYVANLAAGDSVINITNAGTLGASLQSGTTASITGAICANVYAFTPDEQLVSCCSCPVTPNGLVSLSAKNDLASNTLTPAVPTALVVKVLATVPVSGSCTNSAAAAITATQANGLRAFSTTIHATPVAGTFGVTEKPFSIATLSPGELGRIGNLCNFILANGSGFGVCRSCRLGGLGATKQ